MPQIDIPDQLHDLIAKTADALDFTPGHLISRLLFGGLKKMPLHPTQLAQIKAAIEAHAKTPPPTT